MPLGGYWAVWAPTNPDGELTGDCTLDRFSSVAECVAHVESEIAARGGGGVVFSKRGDQPFMLLRKFGVLWPEAAKYSEGSSYPITLTFPDGRPAKLRMEELPTRKRRKTPKEET